MSHDEPWDLRVEHLDEAFGIDVRVPRLSWKLPRGTTSQHAYRLQAGSWDSGRVDADECALVGYAGPPLNSRDRVEWRVKVWTDAGESAWSTVATFEMGLLGQVLRDQLPDERGGVLLGDAEIVRIEQAVEDDEDLVVLGEFRASSPVLGRPVAYPLVLAPTGFTRIADPQGELAVARSVERGRAAVHTVDTAVFGRRERDVRRGFSLPPKIGPGAILDGALHPTWTWAFVRSEPIRFANVVGRDVDDGASPVNLSDYINTQFDPSLSWDDVDWLRSVWDGPVIVKGIQRVEDAVIAANAGVTAIALSNHGGRQLDGPACDVLIGYARRRRSRRTHRDHLRRRGSPWQRHRQGGGGRRVDRLLRWFGDDVRRTMALIGAQSIDALDRSFLMSY